MAYDEELGYRIRDLLVDEPDITETKMFGGLAFLVGGNMAVAASGQGGLLVRVDPTKSEKMVATTTALPMVMRGREMMGWLRVGVERPSAPSASWPNGSRWGRRTHARFLPSD